MTTRRQPSHRSPRALGLAGVLTFGCALSDKNLGEVGDSSSGADDASTASSTDDGLSGPGDATIGSSDDTGDVPVDCDDPDPPPPACGEDVDRDGVPRACENAPDHFNPDQRDQDEDGVADVADLCPVVPTVTNSADSDKDGVGNDCDVCRQTVTQYNMHDNGVAVQDFMFVRNIPWQGDLDEDGIGDVCDNCVARPNCEDYGVDNPFAVGDEIMYDNRAVCQTDDDENLVGDACAKDQAEDAAGPVGVGPNDDFDQDGIANSVDACPRQPVPVRIACTQGGEECGGSSACENEVCDHVDADGDGIGDICDTCPFTANPNQVMDGVAQDEDEDGDFVGEACETSSSCAVRADARPFSFFEISANGLCCTVALVEDGAGNLSNAATGAPLTDPDGLPITVDCEEAEDAELRTCRKLPTEVATAPGILSPPAGCDEALAGTPPTENPSLDVDDFGGSFDALWSSMCFLPQWDQDHDGLGDSCDLCPFAYDPDQTAYVDEEGMVFEMEGKYCNGAYDPNALCGGD